MGEKGKVEPIRKRDLRGGERGKTDPLANKSRLRRSGLEIKTAEEGTERKTEAEKNGRGRGGTKKDRRGRKIQKNVKLLFFKE